MVRKIENNGGIWKIEENNGGIWKIENNWGWKIMVRESENYREMRGKNKS